MAVPNIEDDTEEVKKATADGEAGEGNKGPFVGSFDEEKYNEYMFSTAGPKKKVDYSCVTGGDDDYTSFDNEVGNNFNAVEGEYSVKHTGERFAISRPAGGAGGSKAKTAAELEEEELARAL